MNSRALMPLAAVLSFSAGCDRGCVCGAEPPAVEWEAELVGANVLPPASTPGTAAARVVLTSDGDSITTTITIGIALDSTVTEAHFHTGAPNASGPVAIWLCQSATRPAPAGDPAPTCGTGEVNGQMLLGRKVAIAPFQLNTLRAYGYYASVHTLKHPDGEIRGQVRARRP